MLVFRHAVNVWSLIATNFCSIFLFVWNIARQQLESFSTLISSILKYNSNGEVPLEFKSCILSVELCQIYLGSLFCSKMHYFLFWFLFKYFLVSELPYSKFSRFWVGYWKYIKNYKNQVCLKLDDQGKLVHLLSLRLWDGCLRYSHVFLWYGVDVNVSDGVLFISQ